MQGQIPNVYVLSREENTINAHACVTHAHADSKFCTEVVNLRIQIDDSEERVGADIKAEFMGANPRAANGADGAYTFKQTDEVRTPLPTSIERRGALFSTASRCMVTETS